MQTLTPEEFSRREPDEGECRTEQIVPRFSRCMKKSPKCVYAVISGSFHYCMHPNHLDFKDNSLVAGFPYE